MQSAIKVTATQLRTLEGPYLKWQGGSSKAFAHGVGQPGALQPQQLAFVANLDFLEIALKTASLLIVEDKTLPQTLDLRDDQALWSTPSLKAAMVTVLPLFDPRRLHTPSPLVSAHAHIHPTAQIGARTRIEAGVSIGAGARIGDDCHLHANVVIEDFCEVGHRCVLHAGTVIGSDGFGFTTDPQGRHHKIPQIGIVVLEDDVEMGANCAVDRATLGETRIGQGTKFDNLCHIAHNVKIGKHGLFAGGAMVAGSTTIGDHFMIGGGSLVTDHVTICDRVIIGGKAGVTKNITKPGAYTGYPLEPMKDALRTIQNLSHLTEMRQQLKQVAKRLGIPDESQ